jgi:hypothetical protein
MLSSVVSSNASAEGLWRFRGHQGEISRSICTVLTHGLCRLVGVEDIVVLRRSKRARYGPNKRRMRICYAT